MSSRKQILTKQTRNDNYQSLNLNFTFCVADSVFFVSPENEEDEPVKTGDALGDLTDEVTPGRRIVEFVTAGPKNYVYKLDDGTCKLTIKGITMNSRNSRVITFDLVKAMVLDPRAQAVTMVNPSNFVRNPVTASLGLGVATKTYRKVYTKRALMPDGISTKPFGYKL